jgi:hypothetical protein
MLLMGLIISTVKSYKFPLNINFVCVFVCFISSQN